MATTEERARRLPRRTASATAARHGAEGNERLTAAAGLVLIVLLAGLGVTILSIGPLIWWHALLGMLLIPPVLLKLGSTGWRLVRYYRGAPAYVRRGPPPLPLRLLAPLVVVSTLTVFGTGVALLVLGPSGGVLGGLHKASFVVWFFATAIHVLAHLRSVPRLVAADWRRPAPVATRVPGRHWRWFLLAATIAAGLVVALATVHFAQPWVQWFGAAHGGDG
ncbi:MAG TPA: hypothetical protein VE995_02885 [Gaiellaceae bacterium]|nr:hypothetical protein [Gaiellaceae bacterium]